MRGNWESAEALVLTPNQQLQQQPSMMEDHHPLHSPTTPAWGITDRIVKEEVTDDKNNDSGVSPGHYTSSGSPRSRTSSSTANCSLSPGSVGSGDSQPMHISNYAYSPQSLFQNRTSPLDFARLPGMGDLPGQTEMHQSMDTRNMNPGSNESERSQDLQCPVCQFTTQNRLQFTEHVTGHYTNRDTSDYQHPLFPTTISHFNTPQLSPMDDGNPGTPPSGSERQDHDLDDTEEPGIRTPRLNSQGKVKTFRCKQCTFVAVTKIAFWEHSRGHIKPEKILTCPRCPFVTEYKHHLEYHMRNHAKEKPFKCNKCSYSCVNKSMLNSHMKSHSDVHQYRCANCEYSTKYCHSLKLHLRKYNHSPAMVLNADGSPNPLPIIDVYGTRRGPKQKSIVAKPDSTNHQNPQMMPVGNLTPFGINGGFNPMMLQNPFSIFAGLPVVNGFGGDGVERMERLRAIYAEYARAIAADKLKAEMSQESYQGYDRSYEQFDDRGSNQGDPRGVGAPLDLSRHDVIENNNNEEVKVQNLQKENLVKTIGKNRRKGKAVKIMRKVVESDERIKGEDEGKGWEAEEKSSSVGGCNDFTCQYCDIAFGNEVMYSVHMGYHGFSDPFTCNMCGVQCDGKVSFFLHIAKVKHA